MAKLTDIPRTFIRGIARSWISMIGAILTTVSFPFLVATLLYDTFLHIDNPYVSGFIYMILGPMFILGLVLVFIGLFFAKGEEEVRIFALDYIRDKLTDEANYNRIRSLIFVGIFLTCVNVLVVGVLAYSGYHYMESNAFCGEVCHVPMTPEYTAYQNSSHSRVNCVECHIGSGASWFVKSKISGARQLVAVVADTFARPIETPVHGLRPARDTCEQCHRPEKFYGDRLQVKHQYRSDETNTHVQTVMLMKIGSPGDLATESHGIHWHVAPENEITYTAADWERSIIPEVTLNAESEGAVTYRSPEAEQQIDEATHLLKRTMDCIDCHNRPSHVFKSVDQALDNKIFTNKIPQELPYIKREAKKVVSQEYRTQDEARAAIEEALRSFYQNEYPEVYQNQQNLVNQAIAGTRAAYVENVFPEMDIQWGTYTNNISHDGCWRCHNYEHATEGGDVIAMDCNTCHTILAEEEEDPEVIRELIGG
jgi:nitrate/TMAO reductase-like tetraheme cytochrome c subunit